tara:strand:+ start:611 stop:1876 length:1266 start_codon:yes stop_codon:yes gene_type:complete
LKVEFMEADFLIPVLWEWLEFAVRWLHVITAISWIGTSFYFIALDLGLRKISAYEDGIAGEEWQVHGGGFYNIRKYTVAPSHLPEHLTWFKWEAYATWISGFTLMAIVYYLGADIFLIDDNKMSMPIYLGIIISITSLGITWIIYDLLCKSGIGKNSNLLMILLFVYIVILAWGFDQIFTGRAAFIHLGAVTATIMAFNVFMVIIPKQKIVIAALKAGQTPDAHYGFVAKQRSTHNNYLTLPVLFLMLSNHYPLSFSTEYNWIIASVVFLMGVTIRHYFNTIHARKGNPIWTWFATFGLFIIVIILSVYPAFKSDMNENSEVTLSQANLTAKQAELAKAENFDEIVEIVYTRCNMCHAAEPYYDGIVIAPKHVILETELDVLKHARQIYVNSAISHAMPPANLASMEIVERTLIAQWYEKN